MKKSLKAITFAVAVAAAGNAAASITQFTTPATGGEGVLNIIDPIREISYTRDLGILYTSFTPFIAEVPGFSRTWAADSLLSSFLADSVAAGSLGSIKYSVIFGRADFANLAITTSLSEVPAANLVRRIAVRNATTFIDQYIGGANTLGDHGSVANGSNTAVPANGVAYVDGPGNGGRLSDQIFGYINAPGHSIMGDLGTEMNFLNLSATGNSNLTNPAVYNFYDNQNGLSKWELTTSGMLSFLSPDAPIIIDPPDPAVIPVPGALVLMLSGLGALGFLGRRKSRTTA